MDSAAFGAVFALDAATGRVRWLTLTQADVLAVVVGGDGTVYASGLARGVAGASTLGALDGATGAQLWATKASEYYAAPVIGPGGELLLGSADVAGTFSALVQPSAAPSALPSAAPSQPPRPVALAVGLSVLGGALLAAAGLGAAYVRASRATAAAAYAQYASLQALPTDH